MEYLDNYVLAQIKHKMVLDFDVMFSLKKFSIIRPESNVSTLCDDVDVDENTFGTLIIQLPCNYEGGRHTIEHDGNISKSFNISVTSNARFEYSSFAIVYHRDYKHKLFPIKKGAGAYLVYSLKVNETASIPKERTEEDKENYADFMNLLHFWAHNWEGRPGKLVIGLSNEYTKRNLSFENLKSTDLAIATLLKENSSLCSYFVFTGFLKRTYHGEVPDEETKFDTKYAPNILQTDYDIECLKYIDGEEFVNFQHLDVNFAEEVLPENCFDGVPFYRCQRDRFYNLEGSGFMMQFYDEDNLGFHIAKYYRVPVIVLFKRNSFIDELKKCHTEVADIYKIFIELYRQFYESKPIENFDYVTFESFECFRVNGNFRQFAHTISFMNLSKQHSVQYKAVVVNLLNIFSSMGQLSTIKQYFENNRTLSDDTIPILINQCNKFGWLPFSEILCNMFKEVKKFTLTQKYFEKFIETDRSIDHAADHSTDPNKKVVLQTIFQTILDNENKRHRYDKKKFIHTVWCMAKHSDLDIRQFTKSQSIDDIVPFLIEQAQRDEQMKTDKIWCEMVGHFRMKMKHFLEKKVAKNWCQQNVKLSESCECLKDLKIFLNDNLESTTFNLFKNHRKHIEKAAERLDVFCTTSEQSGKADIVVTKMKATNQNKLYFYQRVQRLYNQMSAVCSSNS